MFLRPNSRIDYALLNGHKSSSKSSSVKLDLPVTFPDSLPKQTTMAGNQSPRDLNTSHSHMEATQAEIDLLESELELLTLEEKATSLKLQLKEKYAAHTLNQPAAFPNGHREHPPIDHRDHHMLDALLQPLHHDTVSFLGLGAGYGDCKYYDIQQFVDYGVSSLCSAKSKCSVGMMAPSKITPDWEADMEFVSPLAWAGANTKILSRLMEDGDLDMDGVMRYLACTLRITQMNAGVNGHTWKALR